jgi:molybdopterin converting factor small subunit
MNSKDRPCQIHASRVTHHTTPMQVTVSFYSYFKDLTGCASTTEALLQGSSLEVLVERLQTRFPKLAPMRKSTLIAVGLDYQDSKYILKDGDEVSLFPPVQGG